LGLQVSTPEYRKIGDCRGNSMIGKNYNFGFKRDLRSLRPSIEITPE
jgi:hypothetical protein